MTPEEMADRATHLESVGVSMEGAIWHAASILRQGQLDIEAKLDKVLGQRVVPILPVDEDTDDVVGRAMAARPHAETCTTRATMDSKRCDCGKG